MLRLLCGEQMYNVRENMELMLDLENVSLSVMSPFGDFVEVLQV